MSSRPPRKAKRGPGPKRARTREKLLSAATALFQRKGIFATSLDEIAAHAGLTKGAIYGNFEDKDELVFAVAFERMRRPRPVFEPGRPFKAQLRELAASANARTPAALKQLALMTEMDLYVLTHDKLRRRMVAFARERCEKSAENLASVAKPGELPLPPLQFAVVLHALFNGLLYQRAFLPDLVTDELVLAALEALAD